MIFQATFHPQRRQKGHHGRQRRALEADPQLVVDGPRLQAMAKLQDTLEQLVAGENTCEGPQKIHRNWKMVSSRRNGRISGDLELILWL